jgi:pyruvate/2-oxoglutarate dehydrogenase complex dihydrolipoamide acyltransferase (E2) component
MGGSNPVHFPVPMMGGQFRPIAPERRAVIALFQRSAEVPQVTCSVDVDLSQTTAVRNQLRPTFEQATNAKMGFIPFFVKAGAEALRAVPEVNAAFMGQGLWLHDRVNIGVVTSTPNGPMVPVIADPDRKALGQIALEIADRTERARRGMMRSNDAPMSTFGISNPGSLGILRDTPIVIPPHVATMTCGSIENRSVVVDGHVVVRPMMSVTLAIDHRALDGEQAAAFLRAFKQTMERADFA